MAFHDVQFPSDISLGGIGGPTYQTDVLALDNGFEVRNANWPVGRNVWNVSHAIKIKTQLDALIAFFRARQGKAHTFRYKDHTDYQATQQILGQTGAKTVQLRVGYTSGPTTVYRDITKPVASPAVTMRRNAGAFTAFTLDLTTGLVTLTPDTSKTITAISQANPGVVTAVGHSYSTNDEIWLDSIAGMTTLNNTLVTIISLTSDTFSIGVNTTSYPSYTSGGQARKFVQNTEVLDWTGQFDVPARFDIDQLPASLDAPGVFTWGDIMIIEARN